MIPYLICGSIMAPLGLFVDKYGYRKYVVLTAGFL